MTKYPRTVVQDAAGADVTYDGTHKIVEPFPIDDYVNVKIDQANAGDTVSVYLLIED